MYAVCYWGPGVFARGLNYFSVAETRKHETLISVYIYIYMCVCSLMYYLFIHTHTHTSWLARYRVFHS